MMLKRVPEAALRPFVKTLWVTKQPGRKSPTADRERVLPTGGTHLVFRLSDEPLRLYDDIADSSGYTVGHALVGGARSTFYLRDVSGPTWSIGAQLHPNAIRSLFGVPADELAGRHTSLDALWGGSVELLREQLFEASIPERQLDVFESILAARLPRVRGVHPAVAEALERMRTEFEVRSAVQASGYSHRRFIELFRRDVGLTPKVFCRVLRFQKILRGIAMDSSVSCADLALISGYSDQPHFNREFREFAGITPGEYRQLPPILPHHVPLLSGAGSGGQIRSRRRANAGLRSRHRSSTKGIH